MIRLASLADADGIARVHVASWNAAYDGIIPAEALARHTFESRGARWRLNLAEVDAERRTTVFERDGIVVGFATGGKSRDEADVGEVWALYVHPHAWGTGAGRALLEEAYAALVPKRYQAVMLWVLRDNARAIRFYEAAGFTRDGGEKTAQELAEVRMRRP